MARVTTRLTRRGCGEEGASDGEDGALRMTRGWRGWRTARVARAEHAAREYFVNVVNDIVILALMRRRLNCYCCA